MNLKEARLNKGLTHEEISILLGVTRSAYTKYENEIHNPDVKTIIKLAEILEVSTDYLLDVNIYGHPGNDPTIKKIIDTLIVLSKENKEKALEYIEMIHIIENMNKKK